MEAKSRSRGFTLVELLVVIAIIIVLAGLLLPALSHAKSTGILTKCKGNVRQQSIALRMYTDDFQGFPFQAYSPARNAKNAVYWFDALSPYAGKNGWGSGVFRCPTYKTRWRIFEGEAVNTAPAVCLGSYAYNGFGVEIRRGLGRYRVPNDPLGPVQEGSVKAPADMYALGDAFLLATWGTNWIGGMDFYDVPLRDYSYLGIKTTLYPQQPQGYNMALVDGHVETMRYAQLYSDDLRYRRRWNIDNLP